MFGAIVQHLRMTKPKLIGSPEVADMLGIPVTTLGMWAYKGLGPKYVRVGKYRRYTVADVESWLEAQPTGGNAA